MPRQLLPIQESIDRLRQHPGLRRATATAAAVGALLIASHMDSNASEPQAPAPYGRSLNIEAVTIPPSAIEAVVGDFNARFDTIDPSEKSPYVPDDSHSRGIGVYTHTGVFVEMFVTGSDIGNNPAGVKTITLRESLRTSDESRLTLTHSRGDIWQGEITDNLKPTAFNAYAFGQNAAEVTQYMLQQLDMATLADERSKKKMPQPVGFENAADPLAPFDWPLAWPASQAYDGLHLTQADLNGITTGGVHFNPPPFANELHSSNFKVGYCRGTV